MCIRDSVSSVESEVSITAYVSDDASDADIQSVENFIEGLDGVASVGFTNKEQALEKFRSSTTSDIIDTLDGQNPLPRSIDVELSDPQLVEQVADAIRGNSTYQQIIGYDTPEQSLKYGQQTVSYTHLDVYKRQGRAHPRDHRRRGGSRRRGELPGQGAQRRLGCQGRGAVAVSYTHLDVYKRQVSPSPEVCTGLMARA